MAEFNKWITLTQISNGQKGDKGDKGDNGESYIINSNCEEVLFFYSAERGYYPSPSTLSFSVKVEGNLQKLEGIYDILIKKGEDFESILGYTELLSEGTTVTVDLQQFYVLEVTEQTASYNDETNDKEKKKEIWNLLLQGAPIKFLLKSESTEVANKIINVRYGLTEDMAKFSINAADISTAIQETEMKFDANGLTIKNGAFTIIDENNKPVLSADDNGNLILTGVINAKAGGEIGGFTIQEDKLLGANDLVLHGKTGLIEAKNIILGEGAQVSKYILFTGSQNNNKVQGQAYLYNPTHKIINSEGKEEEIGLFIKGTIIKDGVETTTLKIFPNGNAQFGEIAIDSENSILSCGNNWSLGTSTATFKNIVASGSIKTAVFEKGTVQAIGGAFLVMASHNIKSYNKDNLRITLTNQTSDLVKNHTVWLIEEGSNIYTPCTIQTITPGTTETSLTVSVNEGYEAPNTADVMIVVGDTFKNDPLIMGISNISSKTGENLIYPYGLTINNYKNKTGKPKLFLGDLTEVGKSGYGLYSDNVYLNGSLTTKSDTGTYAGVNTSTGVNAEIFSKFEDKSKIIFWAGASSAETASIQGAPFQVTEAGSIYASRAELTDSAFINGSITGADIYAARIHGNTKGKGGVALEIYDTEGGIGFFTGYDENQQEGTETCRINANGFSATGEVGATFQGGGKTIKLSAAGLFNSNTGIELMGNNITLKTEGADSFLISNNEIVSKVSLRAENEIRIGPSSNSLQAKLQQVDGGYDLYITGES